MRDYSRFFTRVSANRVPAPLREMYKIYEAAPEGTIFMAGGSPNTCTFPFSKITVELKHENEKVTLEGSLLDRSLQYMGSTGYPPLVEKLRQLQTRIHKLNPDFWETRDVLITSGAQQSAFGALEMCVNTGDPVIFAEPSFSGCNEVVRPHEPRFIKAVQDEHGVCPQKLREALKAEGSPEEIRNKKSGVPKIMYINCTGSNPTGTCLPLERKREIYRLACEYDFLILEDDPYYFVHFMEENPVSFMSIDTEGRVLRCDTISKILSSGMRLGFITGPKPLLKRIELLIHVSTAHASSLPQIIVDELLTLWGPEKFDGHIRKVQEFYRNQRDAAVAALEKHLTGLAEWTVPKAGMFIWLKILGVADIKHMVVTRGVKQKVLLMPGHPFMLDDTKPCEYVRLSYSLATPQQMDEGLSRFAKVIKSELANYKKG